MLGLGHKITYKSMKPFILNQSDFKGAKYINIEDLKINQGFMEDIKDIEIELILRSGGNIDGLSEINPCNFYFVKTQNGYKNKIGKRRIYNIENHSFLPIDIRIYKLSLENVKKCIFSTCDPEYIKKTSVTDIIDNNPTTRLGYSIGINKFEFSLIFSES